MLKYDLRANDIEQISAMTGGDNKKRYLYLQLQNSIMRSKKIDIIVSFLMVSGVKMLLDDLKTALDRGVKIRLLTGNYLGITQPEALYLVKDKLGDRVELRFYNDSKRSFHPKAYIFHQEKKSEIYIGSSNISRSALTSGIEWNYRFDSQVDNTNYQVFMDTFLDLFYNHSIIIDDTELKRYSTTWKKPYVNRDLERYDLTAEEDMKTEQLFQPRGAQIEALYTIKKGREEGITKGLVYAATGIGKTYLAAFDSQSYERVLFVAHRQEILEQAAQSFQNIRHSDNYGFFNSSVKDTDKDVIFASVSSLGKEEYLQEKYFKKDYFDYIVIDEFHHAVTNQYQKIIDYFEPKFLLGLTATPERLDGKNVYAICDYNVLYELSLKDAINKGILSPFRYYAVYDEVVDYSGISRKNGKYVEEELDFHLLVRERYDLIYRYYKKYRSTRALGFCSSKKQADKMAEEFSKRNVKAVAVYSGADSLNSMERKEAVEKLKSGEIQVIFSVDMFNEGVDICTVDMVMFLRPTESPVVFLQQLGRGLRKAKGKEYLNVLDFMGNYEKAGIIPFVLSGQPYSRKQAILGDLQNLEYPDDCVVDFDLRLLDLFQEMAKKNVRINDRIREEYYSIKSTLEKVPTRFELFENMENEVYELCKVHSSQNPFRDYLNFLHELNELTEEEESLYSGIGHDFIRTLETTSMSKSYKMPVLLAFYNDGDVKMEITEEDVYRSCKTFYETGINWKDLAKDKGTSDFRTWDKARYVKEAKKNPVKFLLKSESRFFVEKEGYVLALHEQLKDVIGNEALAGQMKDVIEYRTMDYYRKRWEEE